MRKLGFGLAVALGAGLFLPAMAQAAISYQYVAQQETYSGSGPITEDIFLQETVTGNDTSLLQRTNGLYSYAFYITQSGGPTDGSQSTITGVTTAAPFTGNTGSSSAASLPPNSIDFTATEANGATTGPTGTAVTGQPGVSQILLAKVTFNPGVAATFTLESALHSPGDGGAAGGDGNTLTLPASGAYDLDAGGTQKGFAGTVTFNGADAVTNYTFVVPAAVPEPNGFVLSGLVASCGLVGGLGFAGFRRLQTRRLKPDVPA